VTRVHGRRALPLLALFAAFCAGVLVDGWLRTYGPPKPAQAAVQPPEAAARRPEAAVRRPETAAKSPMVAAAPPPVDYPPDPAGQPKMAAAPAAPTGALSATRLRMPIDGITIESFKGGFSESRGSRRHEAMDIVVPRGTPVHAVQDGTIAKLFFSVPGGTTIYQFDPDARLCFYYAHLARYADGLHDGQHVSQGEVIGYVGTSGNAPPDAPHLHFAIFELNADRKWWQGRPLDPYVIFKERG
jgi:murein DD-endopeptidase MepM/ murein hydrolase activator NlpD